MAIGKLTYAEVKDKRISSLANRPTNSSGYGGHGLNAAELKARMDEYPDAIREKLNQVIDAINGGADILITFNDGNAEISNLEALVSYILTADFASNLKIYNDDTTPVSTNLKDYIKGYGVSDFTITDDTSNHKYVFTVTKPSGGTITADLNKSGVASITKSSSGNVDTYTVTYANGTTSTFTVTNADESAYGAKIALDIDNSTFVMTASLKNADNTDLSSAQIDLPLETMVINGSFNSETKKVVLTLQSGATVEFSVADLVDGLLSSYTEGSNDWDTTPTQNSTKAVTSGGVYQALQNYAPSNIDSDDISDTNAVNHKFVTPAMYTYLENATYQAPGISVLELYNDNTQLSTTNETGTSLTLNKIKHKETNTNNISGTLSLIFKSGNATGEIQTGIAKSSADATVTITSPQIIGSDIEVILQGSNNKSPSETFSKNISFKFYNYAYTIASSSKSAPTTGLTKQSDIDSFAKTGESVTYSAGDYLYFYTKYSGKTIYQYVAGQWVALAGEQLTGTTTITKSNGTTDSYYVYRFGTMSAGGTDTFRVS